MTVLGVRAGTWGDAGEVDAGKKVLQYQFEVKLKYNDVCGGAVTRDEGRVTRGA